MLPEEAQTLTRLAAALPVWMEARQAGKVLVEQFIKRGRPVFVKVPDEAVVIEQAWTLPTTFSDGSRMPGVSVAMLRKRAVPPQGSKSLARYVDRPTARPSIRFLQLDPEDLQMLVDSGRAMPHWYTQRGISIGSTGLEPAVVEPPRLRCIRPVRDVNRFVSALEFNPDYCFEFEVLDSYLMSVDAEALHHVTFTPDNEDPHNLFHHTPAVFHLYSTAREFSGVLKGLSRGRGQLKRDRLEQVKKLVFERLGRFGKPFATTSSKEIAFRFLDPHWHWGQGAPRKGTFAEAASKIRQFDSRFRWENFVTKGMGQILYVARWARVRRARLAGERPSRVLALSAIRDELERHNFSGAEELAVVASIIHWQASGAVNPTTPSVKKAASTNPPSRGSQKRNRP